MHKHISIRPRASMVLYDHLKDSKISGTILLPANICPIIPATCLAAGLLIEFLDIRSDNLELDDEAVLTRLTDPSRSYAGVLWLSPYGRHRKREALFRRLKQIPSDLLLIDDRCLCLPDFTLTSTFSDLVLYSTGYAKQTELGWGGFGLEASTNSHQQQVWDTTEFDLLIRSVRRQLHINIEFGPKEKQRLRSSRPSLECYTNMIINQQNAAIKQKQLINTLYDQGLDVAVAFPGEYNMWRYNILVNEKHTLLKTIFDEELFASSHFQPPTAMFHKDNCPNAERLGVHVVNLFNDHRITQEMARKLIDIVNNHVKRFGFPEPMLFELR